MIGLDELEGPSEGSCLGSYARSVVSDMSDVAW